MQANNIFLDLCFDPKCRMNQVDRYSGVYQEASENLAEHVTEITMFSYLIATKLKDCFGETIDFGLLFESCLLHDIEEVITGDVPRNTKYATQNIKKSLDNFAKESADAILTKKQYAVWHNAKKGKEGFILALSDFLTVAKKCVVEIELRGNISFMKVLNEVLTLSDPNKMTIPAVFENQRSEKYFKDLLSITSNELKQIYWKYKKTSDRYKITLNEVGLNND